MKYIHYVYFVTNIAQGKSLYTDFMLDNKIPTFTELKENINSFMSRFDLPIDGLNFGIANISTFLNE